MGAGQAGLSLGIGLRRFGFDVTIVSDRTPDEIRDGHVMSSQCMFDTAQGFERALGINFWDRQCPTIDGMRFSVFLEGLPDTPVNAWSATFERPARSIDQRLKMPRWMTEFERLGGDLRIETATVESLERYARSSDLVIVAAGKGSITQLFETNAELSPYREPQRSLAMFYVSGLRRPSASSAIEFSLIPGYGEYLTYPALTAQGECDIMLFEAVPGRPMDLWSRSAERPDRKLASAIAFLSQHLPEEAQRASDIALIDENAVLAGSITPRVRNPIATLPSGAEVLGMADAIVVNDPLSAQGANNANKCADAYLQAIIRHDGPFDRRFMTGAFEEFWKIGGPATAFTNQLLGPALPHTSELHIAASKYGEIADRFGHCMDDPADALDWILDPIGAYRYIQRVAARNARLAA
ncbi:styrene monooxygenase/indole monooxygenase family protein [Nocardia yamanashiensis]|uniref:styrene monooxygenase/indole monooxygenase family protein n=1 Tax=Nocardia yamanashiensis TaxID=209247 RepID=UPI001C3FC692|nr:styrene monooxygenase/indole monooxygenase family protein [Nocardia yamanashiensis]